MKWIRTLLITLFCGILLSAAPGELTTTDVVDGMLRAIEKTQTLKAKIKSWERIEEEIVYSEIDIKLQVKPFNIYIYSVAEPNEDVEILYNSGQRDGDALVKVSNWLPNLNLSPFGGRMRKDQHHTIFETGFEYLRDIVSYGRQQALKEGAFDQVFQYEGPIHWEDKVCYKLTITDPTFAYVPYVVKEGETLYDIALKKQVNEYLIVEKNEDVRDFDDVKAGQKILIPTTYAQKTILYIDRENFLHIVQFMYDDQGMFEKYEFHNLEVNPTISRAEFTPDFDDYGF